MLPNSRPYPSIHPLSSISNSNETPFPNIPAMPCRYLPAPFFVIPPMLMLMLMLMPMPANAALPFDDADADADANADSDI